MKMGTVCWDATLVFPRVVLTGEGQALLSLAKGAAAGKILVQNYTEEYGPGQRASTI